MNHEGIKIIIITEGGKIQAVYANRDITYTIVNYDLRHTDVNPVEGVFEADGLECDPREIFRPPREPGEEELSDYPRIYAELVLLDF